MSRRLTLLSCGGAITSIVDSGVLRPGSAVAVAALVQELWMAPIDHTEISTGHSAAATPESWTRLLGAVRDVDGPVLVTHGSDTLGWTAAALAASDVAEERPVVLTAANVPFGEPGSDAPNNLAAALELCRQLDNGVWVVFAGAPESPAVVIEGGFARKTQPGEGSITDVSGSPFATVSAGVLMSRRQPRRVDLGNDRTGRGFSAEVGAFRLWPGLSLPTGPPADRVVIEIYGLGTAPPQVIETVARWTEAGTRVLIVPTSPPEPQRPAVSYPPSAELVATGAELHPQLTFELAVCSQMLL